MRKFLHLTRMDFGKIFLKIGGCGLISGGDAKQVIFYVALTHPSLLVSLLFHVSYFTYFLIVGYSNWNTFSIMYQVYI